MDKTTNLSTLNISDLYFYEQAAKEICTRYENTIKQYDGSIRTDGHEFANYDKFNKIYLKIVEELEKRVSNL